MKKILFLDDCNLFEGDNPKAFLVEIPDHINVKILKALELLQPGAYRVGGDWRRMLEDGEIEYNLLSSGHKSDYSKDQYQEEYKVISGNY